MSANRAFVGHSFLKQDAAVVDEFLNYFRTIQELGIGFSWEHARGPEPKEIAEKVLELIRDKNIFIGICTRKELVIDSAKLNKPLFNRKAWVSNADNFVWKTSDWIIQEIGLAVGRGLHIILLVENGVRTPGNFQGNLEHIPFDRSAVSASFDAILQMIKSLSGHGVEALQIASDQKPVTAEEEVPKKKAKARSVISPRPDWDKARYDRELFMAMVFDNEDGVAKIDRAYRKTSLFKEGADGGNWDALLELNRMITDNKGDISKLESLAGVSPVTSEKLETLARGYSINQMHQKSADTFERAAELTTELADRTTLLGRAAREYAYMGKIGEVDRLLASMRERTSASVSEEKVLLDTLKDIGKHLKDSGLQIAAMVRWLDLSPQDDDVRFSLAYLYSAEGNKEMSLHHYLLIAPANRTAMAWNNLGVAYNSLGMPARAVDAYKRAAAENETLANSNLALKYMLGGFLEEAKAQVADALKSKEPHKNIATTMVSLNEVEPDEEKKVEEIKEKLKDQIDFYEQFGRAASMPALPFLSGLWQGPECVLSIINDTDRFTATGEYQAKSSALMSFGLFGQTPPSITYTIKYDAIVRGRAFIGEVKRSRKDGVKASLLSGEDDDKVLMFVEAEGQGIFVLEKRYGTPRISKLNRLGN